MPTNHNGYLNNGERNVSSNAGEDNIFEEDHMSGDNDIYGDDDIYTTFAFLHQTRNQSKETPPPPNTPGKRDRAETSG